MHNSKNNKATKDKGADKKSAKVILHALPARESSEGKKKTGIEQAIWERNETDQCPGDSLIQSIGE
jgi:hypothetical protein